MSKEGAEFNPDRDKFTKTVNEGDRYDRLLDWLKENGAKFPQLEMVSYTPDVFILFELFLIGSWCSCQGRYRSKQSDL